MPCQAQPKYSQALAAEGLDCTVTRKQDATWVRIRGALDLASIPLLDARLAALGDASLRRLVLDLSLLDFMDCVGLRFILERAADARHNGSSLSLVPGPPAIQRVFELTGTTQQLAFIQS